MKIGSSFASVRSITAEALTTLMPPGRVTLADAVEADSVPASPVLETVVFAPLDGVTDTWIIVPSGRFEASSATVTGFVVAEGTMTSGTPCSEPKGVEGAATPPTDAIRSEGELGAVIGCGNAKLMIFVGVDDPVKPL